MRPFLFLLIAVSLAGCGILEKWGLKKRPSAPAPAQENFLGTISMVNEGGRFVLVDFGGFTAPTPGSELHVRRAGEDVATLRAGSEVRRPFAAADVIQGQPQPGDDVWSKKPTP